MDTKRKKIAGNLCGQQPENGFQIIRVIGEHTASDGGWLPGIDGQLIDKLMIGKDVSEEQQKAVPGQNELSIVRRRVRSNTEGGIPNSPMACICTT